MSVRPGSAACDFTTAARSVVGTGRARIVEDEAERIRALDSIMRHYTGKEFGRDAYRPGPLSRTCIIAIRMDTLRGKDTAAPPTQGTPSVQSN
jgi:hypothetical protein